VISVKEKFVNGTHALAIQMEGAEAEASCDSHNSPVFMQINGSIFILCTKAMAQLSQKKKMLLKIRQNTLLTNTPT
jgi:hypothetical protein